MEGLVMRGMPRQLVRSSVGLAIVTSVLVITPSAFASHDARRFELDANAWNASSSGDDWSLVVPADRSSANITSSFVRDGAAPPADTSYFTGGGSKDLNDVTAWAHTTGDVAPEKNEITNAFAAAYRAARDTGRTNVGDLLLYFGLDRYANNGDAQVGFWFFRDAVGMGPGGSFSGRHRVGDILVLSHFTQGGRVSDINVYAWVGSGGSDGALDLKVVAKDCSVAAADDAACSIVNAANTTAPWTYTPKFGPAGVFPQGSFYEGGINVTRLVPGVQCFKSFMAETRSSQSVTAQLKDLALGPFDTCPVTTSSGPTVPAPNPPARPLLPESGRDDTRPLTLTGLTLLAIGFLIRRSADRALRAARDGNAAIVAARSFEATRTRCSAGIWAGAIGRLSEGRRFSWGCRWSGQPVARRVRRAVREPKR
jgi:hypothetical protein